MNRAPFRSLAIMLVVLALAVAVARAPSHPAMGELPAHAPARLL